MDHVISTHPSVFYHGPGGNDIHDQLHPQMFKDPQRHLGKMMEAIRNGVCPGEAFEKNVKTYGRFDEAVKTIDPRKE